MTLVLATVAGALCGGALWSLYGLVFLLLAVFVVPGTPAAFGYVVTGTLAVSVAAGAFLGRRGGGVVRGTSVGAAAGVGLLLLGCMGVSWLAPLYTAYYGLVGGMVIGAGVGLVDGLVLASLSYAHRRVPVLRGVAHYTGLATSTSAATVALGSAAGLAVAYHRGWIPVGAIPEHPFVLLLTPLPLISAAFAWYATPHLILWYQSDS